MSKVYVTQKPNVYRDPSTGELITKPNLDNAKRYGTLVYVTSRYEVENKSESEIFWLMRERLTFFNPAEDYLLPIGQMSSVIISALTILDRSEGLVRLLQWDRRLKTYELFCIDMHAQPPYERKEGSD